MPFPLIPVAIGILGIGAFSAKAKRDAARANPTESDLKVRAIIYDTALNHCKDPDKLREMSAAFRQQGHNAEADMLLKRAMLREAPPELKATRDAIYKKALASKNPVAIREVAAGFDDIGATGAAASLRDVAEGLETMLGNAGIEVAVADVPAVQTEEAVH